VLRGRPSHSAPCACTHTRMCHRLLINLSDDQAPTNPLSPNDPTIGKSPPGSSIQ